MNVIEIMSNFMRGEWIILAFKWERERERELYASVFVTGALATRAKGKRIDETLINRIPTSYISFIICLGRARFWFVSTTRALPLAAHVSLVCMPSKFVARFAFHMCIQMFVYVCVRWFESEATRLKLIPNNGL